MKGSNFNNLSELIGSLSAMLRPPERLLMSEAAEKYRKINNIGSYVGDWQNATTRYMVEPMDVCRSTEFTACIFVGSAQMAKTDALILNSILHSVICDPMDMTVYQTSMTTARKFSKLKIDKLIRDSKSVGDALRGGNKNDNVFDKSFINGMTLILSWPSINQLSGDSIGRVLLTDYDRFPIEIGDDGNAFDLAVMRTLSFGENAMAVAESTPSHPILDPSYIPKTLHEAPPTTGILALYNRGDRRRWYCQCIHCGESFDPCFKHLNWVDSKDMMESAQSAKMMCPKCSCLIPPEEKYTLNQSGIYLKDGQKIDVNRVVTGKGVKSDIASFWVKGVMAAFSTWESLVIKYLRAEEVYERTGDQGALKTTINTDQGLPYATRGFGSGRLPEELKQRAEDFGYDDPTVPLGVVFLIATIDVQLNHWVVQVHGVIPPPKAGTLFDTIVMDRFSIRKSKRFDDDGDRVWVSPASYLEDWELLKEQVIDKAYYLGDDSGRMMSIKNVACDSGGRATRKNSVTAMAYQYWLSLSKRGFGKRFILVKGQPRPSAPRVEVTYPDNQIKGMKPSQSGQVPVLMINSNKVKDHLNNVLDRLEAGGMIRFSDLLRDSFYTELTVESCDKNGKWENPRNLRNESWDLLHYFFAVCFHLRIDYIDWNSPPDWAESWDKNSLVFKEDDGNDMQPKNDSISSIKALGDLLG